MMRMRNDLVILLLARKNIPIHVFLIQDQFRGMYKFIHKVGGLFFFVHASDFLISRELVIVSISCLCFW